MGEDEYIAAIGAFGGNYAPINYALCQGQLISVQQHMALFSLIGTFYPGAGDAIQTFNLPNLAGGTPIGAGTSPAGSSTQLGETGLTAQVTFPGGAPAQTAAGGIPSLPIVTSADTLGVNYAICMIGLWPQHP